MNPKKALSWIADIFEEPPENVVSEKRRDEIPGWDSLGVLALMAGLDNDFGIVLSAEEMQAMARIDDILQVLRRHGKLEEEAVQ